MSDLHEKRVDAVVTKEAHDVGMVAVDWVMVRDGVGDPQEAASIAVRAALVAAQEAAPALPSSTAIDPPLHPDEREPIALNPLLRGVDLALDRLIRRDCFSERTLRVIDGLRDELTHQVMPSGGVDEDKLAEVRREAAEKAWSEGHAAGRDYQGDGWNCDAHDPEEDNPYRLEAYRGRTDGVD